MSNLRSRFLTVAAYRTLGAEAKPRLNSDGFDVGVFLHRVAGLSQVALRIRFGRTCLNPSASLTALPTHECVSPLLRGTFTPVSMALVKAYLVTRATFPLRVALPCESGYQVFKVHPVPRRKSRLS